MGHHYTWSKLVQGATRLNPKSRGRNYPSVPKWETATFTSGINRGLPQIVPFVGTKSCTISLRAWGVTQSALHAVVLCFHEVDIKTEDPMSRDYFQVKYDNKMYWVHKFDANRNPLSARCSCFTGDTEVLLADGTYKPIKELAGQEGFDIISYNEKLDKFEIVKAYNCGVRGENKEIVRVTLDDGQTIDCTPDHRFLLRDGQWVQAANLAVGDSLRALYHKNYANNKVKRLMPDGKKQTIGEHKGKEDFYVYVYLDPRYPGLYKYETCEFPCKPIYVGKGRKNRYKSHWVHPNRGDHFHNTLKQLKSIGMEPIILKQSVNLTEHVAYKLESQLTHEIGLLCEDKGPLLNRKHGGEGGLSGIAELKVKDQMINNNPMKNPEVAQKVRQANIDNGLFDKQRHYMLKNNPMKNPESRNKATQSYLNNHSKEELSQKGKYMAACRTPETWEKIKQSHKTNERAIKAHKISGDKIKKWNQTMAKLGKHHTQTPEWREFCKRKAAEKVKLLHDHTLEQLVQIVKNEGFVNLNSYEYKQGYNYSISALKSKSRQKCIQEEAIKVALWNHKVVSIEKLSEKADVYCLTAEYFGNFVIKCKDGNYGIHSGIVVENCKDFYFSFAYYNHLHSCLFGPKPRPYKRLTTTRPPRNPAGICGVCKHIYHAWGVLRNSGMTMN